MIPLKLLFCPVLIRFVVKLPALRLKNWLQMGVSILPVLKKWLRSPARKWTNGFVNTENRQPLKPAFMDCIQT
ncbi:hypothetical protein D3C71_1995860 [compost metagenome]